MDLEEYAIIDNIFDHLSHIVRFAGIVGYDVVERFFGS
jgi:hypothetical protein